MNKAMKKRLELVENQFACLPIPPKVAKAAFDVFCATGELPEDSRLAHSVVKRAKAGFDCVYDGGQPDLARSIQAGLAAKPRAKDPLMDELYCEAVFADGIVKAAARQALRAFASAGLDPSQPLFAGKDFEIPDWGGVGVHLLGIPQRFARPPFEQQAARLFARCDALRDRIPQGDPKWFDHLGTAVAAFQERGDLPTDQDVREAVLVDAEFRALVRHAAGEDVHAAMAALDAAATADGQHREEAFAALQAMMRRPAACEGES